RASRGERCHARPVDRASLIERHKQSLGGSFDTLNRTIALQRAAVEDRSLGCPLRLRVELFEREQKGMVGIASESLYVVARVEGAIAGDKKVVSSIQLVAGFNDVPVVSIGELGSEHLPNRVANLKHSANPCADGSREGQRFECFTMTD